MPVGSSELVNSFSDDFYTGPVRSPLVHIALMQTLVDALLACFWQCPGFGVHHYRFRLFAMPKIKSLIAIPTDPKKIPADFYVSQVEVSLFHLPLDSMSEREYIKFQQHEALYVAVLNGDFSADESFVPLPIVPMIPFPQNSTAHIAARLLQTVGFHLAFNDEEKKLQSLPISIILLSADIGSL
jgi:hypothetical protein